MPIGKFFHLIHIVDDHDAAAARYDALLASHVYRPKHWSPFDKRWASLAMIGPDFVIELMEPSNDPADVGSPLPKFRARHGQHLHSMAWFVDGDDLEVVRKRMVERGVRALEPYGPVADGALTFFTFPKDTFGQLELQAVTADAVEPHLDEAWTGAFWRDEHPLGIERLSHLTTIVNDVEKARSFYADAMGAPAFHEETGPDRRSVFVLVGTETVVELAQPTAGDSRLALDLAEHGEIPHAITFKVSDLDAVKAHAGDVGIGGAERSDDTLVLDPDDMFNAVVAFTTRVLPNDPRPIR